MLHLDVFGHRGSSDATRQQFLIADLYRSIRVHQTTSGMDPKTEVSGGTLGQIILVADGVRQGETGEHAARVTMEALCEYLLNSLSAVDCSSSGSERLQSELTKAVRHCEQRLDRESEATMDARSYKSDLTAVFISWPAAFVVQVGRTRCDHWRDGNLLQLANATAPPAGAGGEVEATPVFTRATLSAGDRLLLSTHGLHDALPPHEICQMVGQPDRAEQICRHVVDAASAASGSSHTAVVVCVEDDLPPVEDVLATSDAQDQSLADEAEPTVAEPTAASPTVGPAVDVSQID